MPVLCQPAIQFDPQHGLGIAFRLPVIASGEYTIRVVLHRKREVFPTG